MKIQILSDLHLEFQLFNIPEINTDLVVLVGDIHIREKGIKFARREAESMAKCMIKSYTLINWVQAGKSFMRKTQALAITLPHDMLEMVKAKVARGEYATESEVIRDGLRILQARDAAIEKWLREEVINSYDECETDATLGVPAEQILARIRSDYRQRTTAEQD